MTNTYRLTQSIKNEVLEYSLDKYNQYGILEVFSDALDSEELSKKLKEEHDLTDIIVKEVFDGKKTILLGDCPDKVAVTENDFKFIVQPKNDDVGLPLSQVELRNLIKTYSPGREVLSLFAYTGANSLYAMLGNAQSVSVVEHDPKFIQKIKKNFEINQMDLAQVWENKHVDFIELARESRTKWGLIVLDLSDYNLERLKDFNLLADHKDLIKEVQEKLLIDGGLLFVTSDNKNFVLDQYIRPGADKLTNKLIPESFAPLKSNQVFAFYN
mgnify:CR=1 FL=1